MNEYKNLLVPKPWGVEYLLYENENVALWHLAILPGHSTSLHCHPSKKTGLILLDGGAKLQFLNSSCHLLPGDKTIIRNGMFHSTSNIGEDRIIQLLEIETPNNKHDIIRLMDNYNRAGKPYETETVEQTTREIPITIGNYHVSFVKIDDVADIEKLAESDQIIGIMPIVTFSGHEVMGKADIVNKSTLLRLAKQFGVQPCNAILITLIG